MNTSCPKHETEDPLTKQMAQLDAELSAIEHAARHVTRLRSTPPVDDDFPQVKFEYEQSIRTLVDALRENKRLNARQIAHDIIHELEDRAGFDGVFDSLDKGTHDEILTAITGLIEQRRTIHGGG